jgi:1-deoxy-D-xylulose-5-phosphate synthase
LLSYRRVATPVERIGWPDQFIEHASTVGVLRQKYGLTAAQVVVRVKGLAAKKEPGQLTAVA